MSVREVRLEDLAAVSALMRTVGWKGVTERRWERDWVRNPALDEDGPPLSHGWVLESGERIVGFLGNLIQRFDWRGDGLRAATIWGFVVAPDARGGSMRLLRAFTSQPGVDLLLATTATVQVPEILSMLKFERLPVADYDTGLYWVTGAPGLVASSLRRKGVPAPLAVLLGFGAGPALALETRIARRSPRAGDASLAITALAPERADVAFDTLWERKRAEMTRLAQVRTAAVLAWHFAPEGWEVPPLLLAARRGDELVGYAALVRADKEDNGLRRWQVADLLALADDPGVIRALLRAAWEHAVADGAYMLELFGCPAHLLALAAESGPRPWKKEAWPYLYRAKDPALQQALRSPDAWYPTLIDGDGCLPHV